jgi:inosine-uridine nucleoside N-ribohydrolase
MMSEQPIPVILDTDIGGDIDDTWALAMMLRCPELDVKLVVGDTGPAEYRGKLLAKMLQVGDRTDVSVGLGLDFPGGGAQMPWVEDYDLGDYPGTVHEDGVAAMIDVIESSPEPVTLIAIGPVPNIAELLRRRPDLAPKVDFVGMHGSIARHHMDAPEPIAEYNVANNVPAAQAVFAADWRSITITPLDTCGSVVLDGERYRRVLASDDPLARATIENYRIWASHLKEIPGWFPDDWVLETGSTILFDCVAVHLAYNRQWLKVETMPIVVTDDGYTKADDAGKRMDVAIEWTDKPAFLDDLTRRLTEGA